VTELTLFDRALTSVTVPPSTGEVHGVSTVTVPSVGGAAFLTAVAAIPAGVQVKGVGYRCVTAFSTENSLASLDLGGMGLEAGWGRGLGIVANAVNNIGQMRADMPHTSTAHDILMVANPPGARFGSSGLARLSIFWMTLTPL
jgi:hypothetical protein